MAKKAPAKKTTTPKSAPAPAVKTAKTSKVAATPVRNTSVPKKAAVVKAVKASPSFDQIAKRAFELFASGVPGSETEHWLRAERELANGV